jgi:hypothetical protein
LRTRVEDQYFIVDFKSYLMAIEIEEGSEAKEQFWSVNAEVPNGVSVVPSGFDEFDSRRFIVYPDGTDTVRKLLEQNGVDYVSLDAGEDTSTLVLRSEEIIIPTIYIAYTVVRDNWDQIKYVLQKLSGFYSKRYDQDVEFTIEQETESGETIRFTYKGPADEIETLSDEIASMIDVEVEDERDS